MSTSGILSCTLHENLGSIGPFLAKLWQFLCDFLRIPGRFSTVVTHLLLDRRTNEAENLHGIPPRYPPCPYGVGDRLLGVYSGHPGHFPNCAQIAILAK